MDPFRYSNFLITHMSNAKFASGRRFINCRCPECGDSINPKSAHLYIFIPWNNNDVSWYYCHKCNCKGIVSFRKLLEWDIFDQDISNELSELNSRCLSNPKKSKYLNNKVYRINNTYTTINDNTEFKRQYVCNRVGVDLSYKDLKDLKIVLNINDLLVENNITEYSRDIKVVEGLNAGFMGFLSVDNAFLNMRRICPEGVLYKGIDKRYINYKIFDKEDTSQRFYTIPTYVDLNTPNLIPFHIAEGPFDILSIYLNCRNRATAIYTSVAGCNFLSVILFFIIELRIPNLELHIYPDNDKQGTDYKISRMISNIPDTSIPVYIHRNLYPDQKDFGVPKNLIQESTERIR